MNEQYDYEQAFADLKDTIDAMKQLMDSGLKQYTELVDSVLGGRITGEREIERILDGLLDFGDDERFIEIYRKLCRHVYYHYPQMVGEHVALWKLQFMEPDEKEEFN